MEKKYNAGKLVGRGGFGEAFLCSRIHDDKACIIKKVDVARLSFKERQKATDEANLLAKLSHPNIVRYWEGFFDGLVLCMVMDYAEGGDLSSHLQSRREGSSVLYIAEEQVLGWLVQMTQALGYLHGRNILHRDLKPHNIFLTCSGVVKLGDFGIAKVLENTIDLASTIIGTPSYMSPEMFQHKAYNHKADMWSLGCVLYEMVSLRCAFRGSLIQMLVAQRGGQQELPPIPSSYSAEMHHLIKGLLQNDPEARLSTGDILSQPFVKRYPEDSMVGPLEGPDSAETLEVPWDPVENARMEALRQVDSGDFDIGNPDVFIKQMLNTDLLNILRQVDYAIERGHRSPRVAGLRHPRSPRTAHQEYSPLMIAGWCVGVFAVAAAIMVHVLAPSIRFLSIRNQTQMHDVFRGKEPWVVLCKTKGPNYNSAYSRFETASRTLTELAKFGVVDCSGPLSSGKSITQKFGLTNRLNTPILFVSGAEMKPVQASPWNMDSEASLVKWASIAITPAASPVTSTRSLETKCMKKEQCVLIMLAGQLESADDYALKEVMARHRKVRFVSMDATKLETSIEKRFDIKPVGGAHHFVHFTRYNVPVNAKVYRGKLDTDSISAFLGGNEEKQGLRHAPTVSTRKATKKKRPEEAAASQGDIQAP